MVTLRCYVNVQWMEIKICIRWYPQILLLVVWAHCPLESFCGDGTGFVVIKINWWWLSCSCVHSEKWFKLQFCFENICPRLSCLGVVTATGSGDTQNVAQIWEIGNISAASRWAELRLPEQRLGKLAAMIRSHPATHITSPSHSRHIWGDSEDMETGLILVQRSYRTNRQ